MFLSNYTDSLSATRCALCNAGNEAFLEKGQLVTHIGADEEGCTAHVNCTLEKVKKTAECFHCKASINVQSLDWYKSRFQEIHHGHHNSNNNNNNNNNNMDADGAIAELLQKQEDESLARELLNREADDMTNEAFTAEFLLDENIGEQRVLSQNIQREQSSPITKKLVMVWIAVFAAAIYRFVLKG